MELKNGDICEYPFDGDDVDRMQVCPKCGTEVAIVMEIWNSQGY
jgi:hypothetical protein